MKIKLDENMPYDLATTVAKHDIHTVHQEGLSGCDDGVVFEAANAEGRLLVTQDLDFSDIRNYLPGTHSGILLIRLRNPSRHSLNQKLKEVLDSQDVDSWSGCFVVATDSKIRIHRPPAP